MHYCLFSKIGNAYWLRQLPSCPDVDDGLHNAVTVVVDEGERARLVGDSEGELIVVNEANLGGKSHTLKGAKCKS